MNNKRGISQAFQQVPPGHVLRPATVFDVFDISRVLIRSITELCAADHGNDPGLVAEWTANKDPADIRERINAGAQIRLAEQSGRLAAVGSLLETGVISLLYVDPDHTGCGVGRSLLSYMEQELAAMGCQAATLDASRTAREFYLAQGWQLTGGTGDWNGIPQFPMRKSLHPKVEG